MENNLPKKNPMLKVFSLRDFRLLFAGSTTSLLGDRGADRLPAGRPVHPARPRGPHVTAAAAHSAGHHRLESRPALPRRAGAAAPPVGVRRPVPGNGRVCLRGRPAARRADHRRLGRPGGQVAGGRGAGGARAGPLPAAGQRPRYAAQRLAAAGESGAIQARLRDYTVRYTERAQAVGMAEIPAGWAEVVDVFRRYNVDAGNLRQVLSRCVTSGDAETGLRLCTAVSALLDRPRPLRGRRGVVRPLPGPGSPRAARAGARRRADRTGPADHAG